MNRIAQDQTDLYQIYQQDYKLYTDRIVVVLLELASEPIENAPVTIHDTQKLVHQAQICKLIALKDDVRSQESTITTYQENFGILSIFLFQNDQINGYEQELAQIQTELQLLNESDNIKIYKCDSDVDFKQDDTMLESETHLLDIQDYEQIKQKKNRLRKRFSPVYLNRRRIMVYTFILIMSSLGLFCLYEFIMY